MKEILKSLETKGNAYIGNNPEKKLRIAFSVGFFYGFMAGAITIALVFVL